ncbi:glycine oxidase ThiO [Brachybacterium avium]|uniref:glycine oxidase n=1 Tax=Brachybacterium avium TaxID=2017485 RepID=A0A220UCU0_9MICO|nr:glycine oxidase ThiO [Brachybacterium avium]ASK65947.1 glycine oxidase ThiO [Brachybacterium avium]
MQHVAVVGAGIIGLLTALELRRRGHRVEIRSTGVAEQATHAAAGMLAPTSEVQFGQHSLRPLMRKAASHHRALAAELALRTEEPLGYRDTPTLVVGRDRSDLEALRLLAQEQCAEGAEVEELTSAQLRGRAPTLARHVAGAMLVARDHQVDPRTLVAAVVDALAGPGRPGDGPPVSLTIGSRVASTEEIDADRIILAAGLGTTEIDGPHRVLDLSLRPVHGDILRLHVPASALLPEEDNLLDHTVRALVRGRPLYLVPRGGGLVLGATSREDDMVGASAGAVLTLLQDAAEVLPSVRDTELREVIARARPGTPDDLPLLGPVPTDPRVIVSTGYHRHGILLSAWAAARTADLLEADPGAPPPGDMAEELAAVDPARFTTTSHLQEVS